MEKDSITQAVGNRSQINPSSRKAHKYRVTLHIYDQDDDFDSKIILDGTDIADIVKQIKELKRKAKFDKIVIREIEEVEME